MARRKDHPLRSFLCVCRSICENPATADFARLDQLAGELRTAKLPDGVAFREVTEAASRLYWATQRVVQSWEQEQRENSDAQSALPFPASLFGPAPLEVERDNAKAEAWELSVLADRLESVDATGEKKALPTIWHHGGKSYSGNGRTPLCVSAEMHNVLVFFLDGDEAYDTKELMKAGASNVAVVIDKIAAKFGGDAIRRPRSKGDGYFIRVRSLATPN